MSLDDGGFDTIFGALMLIVICLGTSSLIVLADAPSDDESHDLIELEPRFDCILSSTIELEESGSGAHRTITPGSFAVEVIAWHLDVTKIEHSEEICGKVSRLIDFYFGEFDAWSLGIITGDGRIVELVSRGLMDAVRTDCHVLSRPLVGNDGEPLSLSLALQG